MYGTIRYLQYSYLHTKVDDPSLVPDSCLNFDVVLHS